MILKKLNGLYAVSVELRDFTIQNIGEFKSLEQALTAFVIASAKMNKAKVDHRTVMVFEEIRHPQYKMIRIR